MRVKLEQVSTHLTDYLRRVRAGEPVIIVSGERPVGQHGPSSGTLQERLVQMQSRGLIAWSGEKVVAQVPVARSRGKQSVAKLLVEERK